MLKCKFCDYDCNRLDRLRKHNLIHNEECEAAFTQAGQVKEHGSSLETNLLTQTPETLHSCIDCDYYTKSTLGL